MTRRKDTLVKAQFEALAPFLGEGTMCAAKWLHSTIYLTSGRTKSCHHCPNYQVDASKVLEQPLLLHNVKEKIAQREGMRRGEKHPDCDYCWKAEEQGLVSDRIKKSISTEWAVPALDRLKSNTPYPSYLEIVFDSTCNLACAYCSPTVSSKWMEDLERYGNYQTLGDVLGYLEREQLIPIPQNQPNPYREAFWKWWPELYQNLHVFRITGGEPLLSKSAWRAMDYINTHPREDLIFGINTNLSVAPKLIDQLIDFCVDTEDHLRTLRVYASCEAHGKQAEYIRDGLNYPAFIQNLAKLLASTKKTQVILMLALNALGLFSLDRFLADIYTLVAKYPERVSMDFAYLRDPDFLDVRTLERPLRLTYLNQAKALVDSKGTDYHKLYFDRFYMLALDDLPEEEQKRRKSRLYVFFNEYDKRRGRDLRNTFPELF